ncbi:MAG: hypothetical protein M1822_002041 [Bathelium mastoideum]|nr:MAG: hypothetical protein M1822_002041 [Bathelium mastoideum]
MATETAVSKDNLRIPLIDFSLFTTSSSTSRQAAARAILHGFTTSGFIYLKNHPIPSSVIDHVFAQSAKLFARPKEQKEALAWTTPRANRGYSAPGQEKVTQITDRDQVEKLRDQVPDLKESFEIGRDGEEGCPNEWPDEKLYSHPDRSEETKEGESDAKEFKSVMQDFFRRCQNLHTLVMRAIAVALSLPEQFFDGYTDVGDNTLRLLHYPQVSKNVFAQNKAQVRAGEHTDYGSITLLFQDDRGGLQVQSPEGTFVDAAPIPNTIVVNAADLLARWSNDVIKSTKHRVVEPPAPLEGANHPARYSIAYFCNPNFERIIDAIPGTFQEGVPGKDKKYESVKSGDYLVRRLEATY